MVYNFPHDLVLVVLGVVFRTGNSSGKPLLLPVLKNHPQDHQNQVARKIVHHLLLGGSLIEGRDYIYNYL